MAYESFDPRTIFREKVGSLKYDEDGNSRHVLLVKDDRDQDIQIPIYLSEEIKTTDLPNMPYMYLHIPVGGTVYEPQDIGAATRKMESFIEVHICFTNLDNISVKDFAKKIKNKLQDVTRTNQSTTTGITFMNVEDDGFEWENDGRQVYLHYVATLYCIYYDLC